MPNGEKVGSLSIGLVGAAGALVAAVITLIIARFEPSLLGLQRIRGNSPIKVQGGSMSARVDKNTGPWQVDGAGYCLAYAPNQLSLNDTLPKISGNKTQFTTSGTTWALVLYGADPTQKVLSPSSNGIKMEETTVACNGNTASGYAIHLSLVNSAKFYPVIKQEKDGSSALRFEDTTPGVGGDPSVCSGPNGNPNGDEDGCERLSQINVTIGSNSYGAYDCQTRECSVELGP